MSKTVLAKPWEISLIHMIGFVSATISYLPFHASIFKNHTLICAENSSFSSFNSWSAVFCIQYIFFSFCHEKQMHCVLFWSLYIISCVLWMLDFFMKICHYHLHWHFKILISSRRVLSLDSTHRITWSTCWTWRKNTETQYLGTCWTLQDLDPNRIKKPCHKMK